MYGTVDVTISYSVVRLKVRMVTGVEVVGSGEGSLADGQACSIYS